MKSMSIVFCLLIALWSNSIHAKESKKHQEYVRVLELWVGKSVDELLVSYGAPSQTVDLPTGGKLLTYGGNETVGGTNMGSILFGDKGAILDSNSPSEYLCIVNFAVGTDGLIRAAKIQRNDGQWLIDPCKQIIKAP